MLNVSYSYKNLSDDDKNFVLDYFPSKLERFDHLLKKYSSDDCRLNIKIEKFATKSAYMVELVLHFPGSRLIAKEDDHTIAESVDLALDKIISQLRRKLNRNK